MPNDTLITISRRVIRPEFDMDSLQRLAAKPIELKIDLPNLAPVEALPELNFTYNSIEGVMPVDTVHTFTTSVEVVAYPMDSLLPDNNIEFMSLLTVLYLIFYYKRWVDMGKEIYSCFS